MSRTMPMVALLCCAAGAPVRAQAPRADAPTLRITGEVLERYVYAHAPHGGGADQDEAGFQLRQMRLAFTGTVFDARTTYNFRTTYDKATGTLSLDNAYVAHRFGDGLEVQGGQFKAPFLREELLSAFDQLTAERSYAADYFTVDFTQGVQVRTERPHCRAAAMLHDGSYAANTDFANDRTDAAAALRVEIVAGAPWAAFADNSGWRGQRGVLVGIALDGERGERSGAQRMPNLTKVTADVTAKLSGLALFASYTAQRFGAPDTLGGLSAATRAALDGARQHGLVVQLAGFAVPDRAELFARWETLRWGGVYYRNNGESAQSGSGALATPRLALITAGANWYLRGNAARLTLDAVYAPDDAVPVANTSSGLLKSDRSGEVAVRGQMQLRF